MHSTLRRTVWLAATLIGSVSVAGSAEAKKIKIKHGTIAPKGSPWFNGIKRMGQRWAEASGGKVQLKIYAGGVAGDEGDMLRKMTIGQLHSATVTNIGLSRITRATVAFQIPMVIQSYDELDYVRSKLDQRIEGELAEAGYVVLNWGDAGWVHFFAKKPIQSPDDVRKLALFVWSGDPESEAAWKQGGFKPVPMSSTDVMSSLQSGLIETFATAPLYALTSQWFGLAKNMVDVRWTPLNGATVMSKKRWEKIPAELRPQLLEIARDEGEKVRLEVRGLDEKSVKAMVERGLSVHRATPSELAAWQQAAEAAYPAIRGKVVPADLFDEVKRLAEEHRASKK